MRLFLAALLIAGAGAAHAADTQVAERDVAAQVGAARTQYENMLKAIGGYVSLLKEQNEQLARDLADSKKREQGWAEYAKPLWAFEPTK